MPSAFIISSWLLGENIHFLFVSPTLNLCQWYQYHKIYCLTAIWKRIHFSESNMYVDIKSICWYISLSYQLQIYSRCNMIRSIYMYWFINIDHALWNYELILEWIGFSGVTGSIKALFIKYYLTHSSMSKIHKD